MPSLLSDMNVDRERRQGGFIPFSENENPTNQDREPSKRYDQHVLRLEKAAGRKPLSGHSIIVRAFDLVKLS